MAMIEEQSNKVEKEYDEAKKDLKGFQGDVKERESNDPGDKSGEVLKDDKEKRVSENEGEKPNDEQKKRSKEEEEGEYEVEAILNHKRHKV